jgi:hypothetical protein
MLLEAIALWRVLPLVADQLGAGEGVPAVPLLALRLERPERLALWASALFALIVPVAALYGPLVERYWRIAYPLR